MPEPTPVRAVRLRPGVVVLRRGAGTAQVGLDPRRAVLVRDLGPGQLRALRALDPGARVSTDGSTTLPEALTRSLRAAGLASGPDDATGPRPEGLRTAASVTVLGATRVAAAVAVGLAHAGVGTVVVGGSSHTIHPRDTWPGGPEAADVGRTWTDTVAERLHDWGARNVDEGPLPDVVVLTDCLDADLPWTDPSGGDRWLRAGVEHLWAGAAGENGIVTSLVSAGRTACLHCRELTRADHDRGWPVACEDLRGRPSAVGDPVATSSGVTALVAANALARVLHRLEVPGGPGTTEDLLLRADGAVVASVAAPHPDCGCRWPAPPVMMDR